MSDVSMGLGLCLILFDGLCADNYFKTDALSGMNPQEVTSSANLVTEDVNIPELIASCSCWMML